MKLAEAAHILGISLEDVTIDSLNKTYKKLVMTWDPEKCKDPSAKQKYVQITEAYKKLSSVMEGKDAFRGGEQHEIATLMRMFMDMVGMSENDSLPTAALTFGMMFDSHQHSMEEWSTDEDGDGDYDEEEDDEDEDEEYLPDEYYEDYPNSITDCDDKAWEPQAKTYSNMNLKDQVSKARQEGDHKVEEEKKLKQAKKRAEKRKKQKEKKLKEAMFPNAVDEDIVVVQNKKTVAETEEVVYSEKELERIISQQRHRLKEELVIAVQDGKFEIVDRIVTYNFPGEMPAAAVKAVTDHLRSEIPSYHLLHKCITDFTSNSNGGGKKNVSPEDLQLLNKKKIFVLERLLNLRDPMLDLNGNDESGLSILHKSISLGDIEYTKVIAKVIVDGASDRQTTLNLNSRCHKKGWAPIHYAVDRNNLEAIQVLGQFGANLQATAATDKRLTPLELAKSKLKQAGSNVALKSVIQKCIDELNRQIALQKAQNKKPAIPSSTLIVDSFAALPQNPNLPHNSLAVVSNASMESKSSSYLTETSVKDRTLDSKTLGTAPTTSEKKKKKGDKKPELSGSTSQKSPVINSEGTASSIKLKGKTSIPSSLGSGIVQEISLASRDEMVDRLLGMGFRESDCLAAIARYGTDLDLALSWLVDRPVVTEIKAKAKEEVVKVVQCESSEKSVENESSLQQKKEELRRINRAWNAKAEDEKRKLELQRKQEEAKAKEATIAKVQLKTEELENLGKVQSGSVSFGQLNNASTGSQHESKGKDVIGTQSSGVSTKVQHGQSQGLVYSSPSYVVPAGYVAPVGVDPMAVYGNDPNVFYGIPSAVPHAYSNIGIHGSYSGYPVYDATPYVQSQVASHVNPYCTPSLASSAFPPLSSVEPASNSPSMIANETVPFSDDSPVPEVYLTGAIELSAGAKPFVPKSFTPSVLPPSVAATGGTTLPSVPSSGSLNPLTPTSLSSTVIGSTGTFPSAVLPAVSLPADGTHTTITGPAASFMSALGGSGLAGSTGSLSSLDNNGLGLGSSSLWTSTGAGLTSGLVSAALGPDPFGSLSTAMTPNFFSGILGPDLGLDNQDHFDFDAGNDFIPDLESLLSIDGLPEFK